RGGSWSVTGEPDTLALSVEDGRVSSHSYPDALGRIWAALECPRSGDVLVSAGGGYEFVDWGGVAHVGGGSHGSLHRSDSLGVHPRVRHGLRRPHNWIQLFKFFVVGGSGYAVNLAVFTFCVEVVGVHHIAAATAGWIGGVTNNFWWNRHWTFGAKEGHAG